LLTNRQSEEEGLPRD